VVAWIVVVSKVVSFYFCPSLSHHPLCLFVLPYFTEHSIPDFRARISFGDFFWGVFFLLVGTRWILEVYTENSNIVDAYWSAMAAF